MASSELSSSRDDLPQRQPPTQRKVNTRTYKISSVRTLGSISRFKFHLHTPEPFNQQYSNPFALNLENFEQYSGLVTVSDEIAYLYRASRFNTDVQTLSTTPVTDTIFEKYQKLGEVYVRTFNNTALKTLSDAFSAVFSKYSTAVQDEIRNSVKDFNIINDVIIIKTEKFKVMERFVFDIDQDTFAPYYTFRTELQ